MPQLYNRYSFGSEIGKTLGSGVAQGLSYLAENKINQITKSNEVNNYSRLLKNSGLDPRDADVLAYEAVNRPEHYHQFLQQYTPRSASSAQELAIEQQPAYQQALQQMQEQPQQQMEQQQYRLPTQEQQIQLSNLLKNLGNPGRNPSGLGNGLDLVQQNAANQLLKTALQNPEEQHAPEKQAIRQEQVKQQAKEIAKEFKKEPTPKIQEQSHPLLAAKAKEEKIAQQRLEAEEKKERREDEKIAREETKEYFQDVIKRQKTAEKDKLRALKIRDKAEKGTLPSATFWNFLTHVEDSTASKGIAALGGIIGTGLGATAGSVVPGAGTAAGAITGGALGTAIGGGLGGLTSSLAGLTKSFIRSTNPDVEELEQLSSEFVQNAKQYFGGRLTDADLAAFMKTIPTIANTDAAKIKMTDNMIEMFDLAEEEGRLAREIVKKNDNKRPIDLEDQVHERLKPKIDALYKKIFNK